MAASPNDPRHFLYPLNRTSEYDLDEAINGFVETINKEVVDVD